MGTAFLAEVAVEVEVEESAVEVEIEVEAAQSRSARIRAAFREMDGVDVPAMLARVRGCGRAERAQIFAGSIPQCRARGSGGNQSRMVWER